MQSVVYSENRNADDFAIVVKHSSGRNLQGRLIKVNAQLRTRVELHESARQLHRGKMTP
jgi:hypothetical protein